jgi:glycosyltransferase involved in cell wall biosynthesis
MRVLSVIETLLHGGAETVLVDLVSRLPTHEHRVVHFSGSHGAAAHPWIADRLSRLSIPLVDVHWEAFNSEEGRRSVLGDFDPDVVLFHWWGQDPWFPWVSAARSQPVAQRPFFVLILHRSGVPVRIGYDSYVLVTPTQQPQVAAVEPERVHVIPNGVDLTRFRPRVSRDDRRRPFTVGRLSNLRPGKIPPDWVRTAAGYGLRGARFVIAGDGPLRSVLESDICALGLQKRFVLPGYVARENVARVLATFDVFCYVTATAVECHPLALLEAAAAGLPIVAEPRGGVADIVEHRVTGLLAGSPADIGMCLRVLRRNKPLRMRLGRGARKMASRFSLDRQMGHYADLLLSVRRARQ